MVREFLEHLAGLTLRKALGQGIGEVRTGQNPILRQAKTAHAREFLEGIGGKGVIRGCGGKKGDGGKGNRVTVVTIFVRYSLVNVTCL